MSERVFHPAKLKSPSGQVVTFSYEDLESSVDAKAAVFETVVGNGTYVQPNGHTSGRFPMACFIHGGDYWAKAKAFMSAVLETGEFVFTHPVHGDINVVVVGRITRVDALKTAANQVVYTLEFYETTGLQIGESGGLPQVFDGLIQASAVDFSEKVALNDPVDKESFKNRVTAVTSKVSAAMKKASRAVAKINEAIEDTGSSINRGLDVTLGEPLTLARQCQLLIGEPRRQNSSVNAKLSAYQNLAANIFSGTTAEPSKYSNDASNTFHLNRLTAQSILGNMAMLSIESDSYKLRSEYFDTTDRLMAILEAYQAWHDTNFASLDTEDFTEAHTDTGDGVAELVALIHGACGELIARSFGAKSIMAETLTHDEAILPLCYRLMGSAVDPTLDEFIALNDLVLDELITIPTGREIVWYV